MASGAGQNQVRAVLLDNVTTADTAVANPTVAYGTIGANDSGGLMTEAQGYSKWTLQLVPLTATALAGYQFTVYLSISPNVYATFTAIQNGITPYQANPPVNYPGVPLGKQHVQIAAPQAQLGFANAAAGFFPGVQPYEWVQAPGPSEQGGTGVGIANPLTPTVQILVISCPADAIRVVLTTAGTAGACRVVCKAIP